MGIAGVRDCRMTQLRGQTAVAAILSCTVFFAVPALGQRDPKTALLDKAGWDALSAGQPRAAAEAFS